MSPIRRFSVSIAMAGMFCCAVCLAQTPAKRPEFEVAAVKINKSCGNRRGDSPPSPGRLVMNCMTVKRLIQAAYVTMADGAKINFNTLAIEGGPGWMDSEMYDINAKAEGAAPVAQMAGPMLQALLEDRFQLKVHRETKEAPVYFLAVAKNGPKFEPAKGGNCTPFDLDHLPPPTNPGEPRPAFCGMPKNLQQSKYPNMAFEMPSIPMAAVCSFLHAFVDRPIIDKTGLAGNYDLQLQFAMERPPSAAPARSGGGDVAPIPLGDSAGPNIFAAVQQQLGLILERGKGPVDVLVIDHVERPSEN